MSIPDYQMIMLPLLKFLADDQVHTKREAVGHLAEVVNLTEEERKQLLHSGKTPMFSNRVGWARTYLKKAGLVKSIRHGYFAITDQGKQVLSKNPEQIDAKYLEQFPEFMEFKQPKKEGGAPEPTPPGKTNPEEVLETAYP